MSLKNLLLGVGRKVFGKKPDPSPATGKSQKLIAYEGKASQETGKDLAIQELKNPPVVLKKTKPLQMGDDMAPAFGSSTYDWAMKMGRGQYSADEWLNHLTSTRKVNLQVFGRPISKLERGEKRFKYDSGPFAGKEVNVSKEELFDTNLAIFNEAGDLTGGLLYAAKKFGLKLDANEIGSMIKLNPVNRLVPVELGLAKGTKESFDIAAKNLNDKVKVLQTKFKGDDDLIRYLDEVQYEMNGISRGSVDKGSFENLRTSLKSIKRQPKIDQAEKTALNKLEAELNSKAAPMRTNKTQYGNETNYTLQGGKDYRETIL